MSRKLDSSPARVEVSRYAEPKATAHADPDLAVDLVAEDDLDAQPLALEQHPLGGGEPGSGGLDADRRGGSAEELAG